MRLEYATSEKKKHKCSPWQGMHCFGDDLEKIVLCLSERVSNREWLPTVYTLFWGTFLGVTTSTSCPEVRGAVQRRVSANI